MKQIEAIDSMEKFMDKVGDSSLSYGQIKDLDDFNGAVFRVKLRQEELTEEQNEVVETTGKLMNELFDFYERMTESDSESENENILDIRKKRSVNEPRNLDPGNSGLSYIKDNEQEMVNQMLNIEEFLDKTKSRQKCGPTIEKTFEDIKKIQKKLKEQLKSINPKDAQSMQRSFIKLIYDFHHNYEKQTINCQKIWGRKLVDQFGRDEKIASPSNYEGKIFKQPEDCKEPCKTTLNCEGWTFDDSGEVNLCHLKTELQGNRFSESWNENFWSARLVDCSSEMKRECKYKAYNQCIADICQDDRMTSCYDRNDIKTFDDKDRKKHNTYNREISCFLNHCPWMPQIDLSTTILEVTEYLYSNLELTDSECKNSKATCSISVKSLLDAYIQLDADQKTLVTSEFIKQVYYKVELPERARIEAELKDDTAYHQNGLLDSTISFKSRDEDSSIDVREQNSLDLVFKPQKLNKTKPFYTAPKATTLSGSNFLAEENAKKRDRRKAIINFEDRVDVLNDMTRHGDLITSCINGKKSLPHCEETLKKPTFTLLFKKIQGPLTEGESRFSLEKQESQKLKIFSKEEQEELLELVSGENSKERKKFIRDLKSKNENDITNQESLSDSDKEHLKKLGTLTGKKDRSRENARTQINIDKESLRKEVQTSRKESLTDGTKIASYAERSSSLMPQRISSANGRTEVSGIGNIAKMGIQWQKTYKFIKNVPDYVGLSPKGTRTAGKITGLGGTISNG